ncbi:MAG: gliding motility-associated C-terminal domain-containing protein [Chitinophagaceae bacterium]|nr:MAG: gliding motility-associated C-terminal domain-containing protein [Chitinophagaceae bacterium]
MLKECLRLITLTLVTSMLFFIPLNEVKASHAVGGDITYECLGNNEYLITMNYYNDCDGINAPTSVTLQASSASCGVGNISIPMSLQNPGGTEVSGLCPSEIPNSACNNGNQPGIELFIWQGTVTLPQECPDWVISYSLCCRNVATTNLIIPTGASNDLYLQSTINNVDGLCNNSVYFTTIPTPYICIGESFTYNHGPVDPDGDSLAFTMINPLDGPGSPIAYNAPFNVANPVSTTTGFTFNPLTGQMTFTPDIPQVVVITVLVEEFRDGELIGSVLRDLQIYVINCTNQQPVVSGLENVFGGIQTDVDRVELCPGDSLYFEISVTDPDTNDILTITTNAAQSIPDANVNIILNGNEALIQFSWTPTANDMGVNILTINIEDDACPIFSSQSYAVLIFVLPRTTAGPDLFYCPSGGPVQLNASGGSEFVWTPSTGLSNDTISNPLASPTETTTYIVTSNLSATCVNSDTVTVFVVPDFVYNVSSSDTICRFGLTTLSVDADPNFGPYTYNWFPEEGLNSTVVAEPNASPMSTTTYYVEVTSDTGCTVLDSVQVVVSGVAPLVELSSDRNNVCPGDSIQLTSEIFPVVCGEALENCGPNNPPQVIQYGSSTTTQFGTPFQGTSTSGKAQILFRASDLLAQGIGPGTISRIALDIGTKNTNGAFENLTLSIGCTESSELNSSNWEGDLTQVFFQSGYITTQGWNNFNFQTPYDWDGVSNLVIEICYQNQSSLGGIDVLNGTAGSGYTSVVRNYANNQLGCGLTPTFTYTWLPNIRFTWCPAQTASFTYSWSPTTNVSDPTSPNPSVMVDQDVTYFLTVDDGECQGIAQIDLAVDSSFYIFTSPDVVTCDDSVQIEVFTVFPETPSFYECGANNSPCITTPRIEQVGSGTQTNTTTGYPNIYGNWYRSARHQLLFRAADLNAAGIDSAGTINSIAFNISQIAGTTTYNDFRIRMACTESTQLSQTNWETGLETVFTPKSVNITPGWNTYVLDIPYDWDGVTNLVVEVCFSNLGLTFTNNSPTFNEVTPYTSVLWYRSDTDAQTCSDGNPSATFGAGESNQRPNTRFNYCDAVIPELTYEWEPSNQVNDPNIANPIAIPGGSTTQFDVTVTFPNGCVLTDQLVIEPIDFETNISNDTVVCKGNSAQLLAGGGVSYDWSPQAGLSCTDCPNPTATPDTTTTYTVQISNEDGCVNAETVTVELYQPPVSLGPDSLTCVSSVIVLDPGSQYSSYEWSTGSTQQTIPALQTGTYSVTITDADGCPNSDSIYIESVNPLFPNRFSLCAGESVEVEAEPGFLSYQWTTGDTSQVITISEPGSYTLTVEHPECGFINKTFLVDEILVTASAFANPEIVVEGDVSNLSSEGFGGTEPYTYSWTPAEMLDDATAQNPNATVTDPTTFVVMITDTSGCSGVDSIFVDIFDEEIIYVPNAFAPERGGVNSVFEVIVTGPATIREFRVFNRWGQVVHDDPANGWDGTFKGQMQPTGTYVFYAVVELVTGETKVINESFHLLR